MLIRQRHAQVFSLDSPAPYCEKKSSFPALYSALLCPPGIIRGRNFAFDIMSSDMRNPAATRDKLDWPRVHEDHLSDANVHLVRWRRTCCDARNRGPQEALSGLLAVEKMRKNPRDFAVRNDIADGGSRVRLRAGKLAEKPLSSAAFLSVVLCFFPPSPAIPRT